MSIKDLEEFILINQVPEDAYSLNGGLPNEAYCINREENQWEVYYSERGRKCGLVKFDTESSACDYFQSLISRELQL